MPVWRCPDPGALRGPQNLVKVQCGLGSGATSASHSGDLSTGTCIAGHRVYLVLLGPLDDLIQA